MIRLDDADDNNTVSTTQIAKLRIVQLGLETSDDDEETLSNHNTPSNTLTHKSPKAQQPAHYSTPPPFQSSNSTKSTSYPDRVNTSLHRFNSNIPTMNTPFIDPSNPSSQNHPIQSVSSNNTIQLPQITQNPFSPSTYDDLGLFPPQFNPNIAQSESPNNLLQQLIVGSNIIFPPTLNSIPNPSSSSLPTNNQFPLIHQRTSQSVDSSSVAQQSATSSIAIVQVTTSNIVSSASASSSGNSSASVSPGASGNLCAIGNISGRWNNNGSGNLSSRGLMGYSGNMIASGHMGFSGNMSANTSNSFGYANQFRAPFPVQIPSLPPPTLPPPDLEDPLPEQVDVASLSPQQEAVLSDQKFHLPPNFKDRVTNRTKKLIVKMGQLRNGIRPELWEYLFALLHKCEQDGDSITDEDKKWVGKFCKKDKSNTFTPNEQLILAMSIVFEKEVGAGVANFCILTNRKKTNVNAALKSHFQFP